MDNHIEGILKKHEIQNVFSKDGMLVCALGFGDFAFFLPIFTAIADFPWVTQTKTMVFLKSSVA